MFGDPNLFHTEGNVMTVEEEYLDVLQNIELAIVSTCHDHPEKVDAMSSGHWKR